MTFYLVTFCCAFAALGSFLFGYDSGMISSSIEQEAFLRRFGSPTPSDAAVRGVISSYIGETLLFIGSCRDPDLIFVTRRRNCGLGPRFICFGLLWPPNGPLHRRSSCDSGCWPPGRRGHDRNAYRRSMHRGSGNWADVCHYSRLLCRLIYGAGCWTLSDVNPERGCPATDSGDVSWYAAMDDWLGVRGCCE